MSAMPTIPRRAVLAGLAFVLVAVVAGVLVTRSTSGGPQAKRPEPTATGTPGGTPSVPSTTSAATPSGSPPTTAPEQGFVLATFNTLGSSHTSPTGKEPELASGAARTPAMVDLLAKHRADVVGLQEFQGPQYRTFQKLAGDTYATYSVPGDTENALAWRRDRWQRVSARTFPVPYFGGHVRQMPIVRLRDRSTGQDAVFVNVHNPADTRQFHRQGEFRAAAVQREVALVTRLARTGLPVFLTGDLNNSSSVFCALTAHGLTTSASGGRPAPGCRPPAGSGIDWIFGRGRIRFSDYTVDRSPRRDGTSDHPFVATRVTFQG
jgi:endonuclease/exonuclease/phosphatase family metal-dependent hydrolase